MGRSSLSLAEKDAQDLRRCSDCLVTKVIGCQVAKRMGKQDIRVVGNALNLRHRAGTGYERLGADDSGRHARLFKCDSVVHTAR